MSITIDMQIKCLSNEIERRKKVFPKLIEARRITEEKALVEIEAMRAAYQTLTQLKGLVAVNKKEGN